MYIENGVLRVTFSDIDGSIIEFKNKKLGIDVVKSKEKCESFRLSIPLKDDWTYMSNDTYSILTINKTSDSSAEMIWNNIYVKEKTEEITITANVWLDEDNFASNVKVENNSTYTIDYVWYPIIGGITKLTGEDDDLYRPDFGGNVEKNIYEKEWGSYESRFWYASREFKMLVYPSSNLMQWISLSNSKCGMYFNSKDNKDFYTCFFIEHERKNSPMKFSIVKAPYIEPRETYTSCENIISFYSGTWHKAAEKYRDWLAGWLKPKKSADWIRELDGWLAFQGHAGDMHIEIPYCEYPSWLKKAQSVGLNTIHIHCGVHEEGIEGGFPYWSNFSKRMGGRKKLVEVLKQIKESSGHAVTFTKVSKVNIGLPEFHEKFSKHTIKLRDGSYPRACYAIGTLDMLQTGAQLANMCHADKIWQDFIVYEEEKIAETGFDGNMIDEWCTHNILCMSKDHGHKKPVDQIKGQLELGRRISEVSLRHNAEYLLAAEEIWDASYEFMDMCFGRGSWGGRFFEIFKYSMPWIKRTAEINENNYEFLNYSFSCGFMFALCFDNYHSGPEAYPEFSSYLKEIIRIRGEVREYFLDGEFRDYLDYEDMLEAGYDNVKVKSYKLGTRELIIVYNNGDDVEIHVPFSEHTKSVILRSPFNENIMLETICTFRCTLKTNFCVVFEVMKSISH